MKRIYINPRIISAETAIAQIRQLCLDGENDENLCHDQLAGKEFPLFFMVGAGISFPPVPLASEIIERCRQVASKNVRNISSEVIKVSENYSYWFQEAYPHPKQRQRFLRKLIEKQNISHANFLLARILHSKSVTNLAITSNFDDFLSRALAMFGTRPLVCDHPHNIDRINLNQYDVQIVHIHGTYWFYDCCNLNDEIVSRAKSSEETSITMVSLLDSILAHRSPMVVGYRGWEDDVFMSALKRRLLSRRIPYTIYWFCYTPSEIEGLPDWLKHHEDVRFVVSNDAFKDHVLPFLERVATDEDSYDLFPVLRELNDGKNKLEASYIFGQLISTFGIIEPELIADPLSFFRDYLESSLPKGTSQDSREFRSIMSAISRIDRAVSYENTRKQSIRLMYEIEKAIVDNRYHEVIYMARQINFDLLPLKHKRTIILNTLTAANGLGDNSLLEVDAYTIVADFSRRYMAEFPSDEMAAIGLNTALFCKGLTLSIIDRHDEAITCLDEVIQNCGDATDPEKLELFVKSMQEKGDCLQNLNKFEEAINCFDVVLEKASDLLGDADYSEIVADSLLSKIECAYSLNETSVALDALDKLTAVYEVDKSKDVHISYLRGMIQIGMLHVSDRKLAESLPYFQAVVESMGETDDADLSFQYVRAMLFRGDILRQTGDIDGALRQYRDLVVKFGDFADDAVSSFVKRAKALVARIEAGK